MQPAMDCIECHSTICGPAYKTVHSMNSTLANMHQRDNKAYMVNGPEATKRFYAQLLEGHLAMCPRIHSTWRTDKYAQLHVLENFL